MRSSCHRRAPALLALAVCGCPGPNSENQTLEISTPHLYHSANGRVPSGSKIVQHSTICPSLFSLWAADGVTYLFPGDCYEITRNGSAFEDESCIQLELPGETRWEYLPRADCPFEELRSLAVPDAFALEVVEAAGLEARLDWWLEESAEAWLSPGPRGAFPDDWIPDTSERLQLVAGQPVDFPIKVLDEAGQRVAYDAEAYTGYESRTSGGSWAQLPHGSPDDPGYLRLTVGEHQSRLIELWLGSEHLPVTELVATSAASASSIEVVVAYDAEQDGGPLPWGPPGAARAVVRDAGGEMIYGAPVEWSLVEGHLALGDFSPDIHTPPEYAAVGDVCDPPPPQPERREAVLRATLGGLTHEVHLEWTAFPEDDPDAPPFVPSPACVRGEGDQAPLNDRGCACATSRAPSAPPWWAALLLLGLRRRRRA